MAFARRFPMVVVSVHDGDTCRAFLDQGGDGWWLTNVRLHGVAARELDDPGGPEARDYLTGLLARCTPPTVPDMLSPTWQAECESISWDKFGGRIQGRIWLPGQTVDVATLLITSGFGVAWDGRGKQPKPDWPIVPRAASWEPDGG